MAGQLGRALCDQANDCFTVHVGHHQVKYYDHRDRGEQQSIHRLTTVVGSLYLMLALGNHQRQRLTDSHIIVHDQDRSHDSLPSSEVMCPDVGKCN
jgi:hypothetical protein